MIRKVNFGCVISVYWKNAIYCNSLMSAGNANNGTCCCGVLSSSSATLGTSGSESTSKMPGISSMCEKQASHDCLCSLFLLIAEMGLGLGHSQCCLLPGVTWEGCAARQMRAAVMENCQDWISLCHSKCSTFFPHYNVNELVALTDAGHMRWDLYCCVTTSNIAAAGPARNIWEITMKSIVLVKRKSNVLIFVSFYF